MPSGLLKNYSPVRAMQWHPTKNVGLSLETITAGSEKNVWWLNSECGHEWQARIYKISDSIHDCWVCANERILVGFNDFATVRPDISAQWHPTKNGSLTPQHFTVNSSKKVWWQDEYGHEWEANIYTRTSVSQPVGCPVCSNKKVLSGFNDLATTHPELAAQWHPVKNGNTTPQQIVRGTSKKYWWVGSDCGHDYIASPNSLTNLKDPSWKGCGVCHGKQIQTGFNDLATTNPELITKWHPTKNGDLTPYNVTGGSGLNVWWISECGHEWQGLIKNCARGFKVECAVCHGKQIMIGANDLTTTHPGLIKNWHPTKNGDFKPTQITAGSDIKVWWIGNCGHEWKTSPCTYIRAQPNGCPICNGKQILLGFNDLATTFPNIATQWHPTKNNDLTPYNVTKGKNKKVWWQDEYGHEWFANINSRTSTSNTGCPICARESNVGTSYAEKELRKELGLLYSNTASEELLIPRLDGSNRNWKCDIGITMSDGQSVIIEYDGSYWHNKKQDFDKMKADILRSKNYIVIRVRVKPKMKALHEHDIEITNKQSYYKNMPDVARLVADRLSGLGFPPDRIPVSAK